MKIYVQSAAWCAVSLTLVACASRLPRDWGTYDSLKDPIPPPPLQLRGVDVSPEDYKALLDMGEGWFRHGAFGNERTVSDVMGVFGGTVDVPKAGGGTESVPVLPIFFAAIDELDGVQGNLFTGNGGPEGKGYTSDLVLKFPPGTTLYGTIPVPERLHTGLEIDAGSAFPIGVDPVRAPPEDEGKTWIPKPSDLGYAGAPEGRYRLRLACAACHYSLDIDNDGLADMRSTERDNPTPGAKWKPQDGWGVGNQDISFGWLFGLAANPLLGTPVLAGVVGSPGADDSREFIDWVLANYKTDRIGVQREVVAAMLAQPRGFADVTTDGILNPMQIPTLYTRNNWPSNSEGAQSNDSDRNNTVWTGALDFTGLIDLCAERGSSTVLPWEPTTVFSNLKCEDFADLMTRYSPEVTTDPSSQRALMDDILGISDGVPGLLNPEAMVVTQTLTIPKEIVENPHNAGRTIKPGDLGGDAGKRGAGIAALGMRIAVEPSERAKLQPYADKYKVDVRDIMSASVSLALDWMDPPANNTPLLAASTGLVEQGHAVFREAGCEGCHRGPFATDNVIHNLSDDPAKEYGLPRAPTTAGWRVLDRGAGPAIETEPQRTWNTRNLRRLISPPYDPATGVTTRAGGPISGFLSVQNIGYKTTALRFLWASAPYLHDGGVAIGLDPSGAPEGTDLKALLGRASSGAGLVYGTGKLLTLAEGSADLNPRANAALSLQALVLRSEREKVVEANARPEYTVWKGATKNVVDGGPPATTISAASIGIAGYGHDFYLEGEVAGGDRVTALVAYLLALDDCPRDLPGAPSSLHCTP